MNIAILTHPLGANYGGILQAYALTTVFRQKKHDVFVLRRDHCMPYTKRILKQLMILLHHPRYNNPKYKNLRQFVATKITESPILYTSAEMTEYIRKNKIDYVVVGSDQVWRSDFAMGYDFNYFLDFVPDNVKCASYAASFGLSKWGYTKEQSQRIKELLRKFTSVSVREYDGQQLCKDFLGYDVDVVLDPTMLLSQKHYEEITSSRLVEDNYIYVYWLGDEKEKNEILKQFEGKRIVDISLRHDEPLCSIGDWLSYIRYADIVVTDSFHGCVFSMLFHRQFVMHVNMSGGFGRIESLYKLFGLEYKLTDIYQVFDYNLFEGRLEKWRKYSINYIDSL